MMITLVLIVSVIMNVYAVVKLNNYKYKIGQQSYIKIEDVKQRNESNMDILSKSIEEGNIKNEKNIQLRAKNNGSTQFSPVFQYAINNNLRKSVLIYFTDGVGEKELRVKPINKNIIWVISGNEELSLKNPYGEIKRINKEGREMIEGNIGLKMVNEAIHEWAR